MTASITLRIVPKYYITMGKDLQGVFEKNIIFSRGGYFRGDTHRFGERDWFTVAGIVLAFGERLVYRRGGAYVLVTV